MLASALLGIPEPRTLRLPVVRQSLVTAYEDCPVKGMFARMGVRGYGRSPALDTGGYAHTVIRILATGGSRQDAIDACHASHALMLEDLARHPASEGSVERIPPDILDDRRKDLNLGIVSGLVAWEPLQRALDAGRAEIIASELSRIAVIPLPAISKGRTPRKIRFKVNADLVLRTQDGTHWLWDLKTADRGSRLSDVFANAFRRVQVWGYWRGYRALYPDVPVGGFYYQGILKPTIVQKRNQSLDDYIAEIFDWHKGTGRHADKADDRAANPTTAVQQLPMHGMTEIPRRIAARMWRTHKQLQLATDLELHEPHERSCYSMGKLCTFAAFCDDTIGNTWRSTFARSFTTDPDPLDSDPTRTLDNR